MSLTHWSPAQIPTCAVTAWINPGHGFVEFNCGNRTSSIGFYPAPLTFEQKTLTERTEAICELALKGEGLPSLGFKQFMDLRRLGVLGEEKLAHRLANLPEGLLLLNGIAYGAAWSSYAQSTHGSSGTSVKSSPSCGSSSSCSKSSPSYKKSVSPSITTAYQQLPPFSSLSTGVSTTNGLQSRLLVDQHYRGWVRKDACGLLDCVTGKIPCMTSRIETTPDKVEKAWQEMKSTLEELAVDESNQCASEAFHKSTFQVWSNNCLKFMERVMDATGIKEWRQNMKYTSGSTVQIPVAWHYFNYILKK